MTALSSFIRHSSSVLPRLPRACLFLPACSLLALALASSATAAEREYASTQGNTARLVRVWIPDDVPHIRGLFVVWKRGAETWDLGNGLTSSSVAPAGFGTNPTTGTAVLYYHPEWREFLSGLGLGLMLVLGGDANDIDATTSRNDDPYGGGDFIHDVLPQLGADSNLGHPELAHVPLLLHGHSRTAKMVSSYASLWPARSLGFIQYHGENNITGTNVDPGLAAAGQVPALLLAGELDTNANFTQYDPYNLAMLATGRASDARWLVGNQWGLPHGGGTGAVNFQRHTIIFPWIASTLNQRLPERITAVGAPTLRLPPATYLGDHLANFIHGTAASFTSPETKCWLPGPAFGALWKTYFDSVSTGTANADTLAQTLVTASPLRPSLVENAPVGTIAFGLVRTGAATASLTVNLAWNGTATPGTDYATPPASVTFPAGQRRVLIALTPLADATAEPEETIILAPATGAGYTLSDAGPATIPLADFADTLGPATTPSWTGAGADNAMSTPANWSSGTLPASGASTALTFGPASRTSPVQDLAAPFTLNTLTFSTAAPAYTLTGSPLAFAGPTPTITQNSVNLQTLSLPLAGTTGLRITGGNTLVLTSPSSTLTGTLALESGTLRLTDSAGARAGDYLGQGGLLLAGGTLYHQIGNGFTDPRTDTGNNDYFEFRGPVQVTADSVVQTDGGNDTEFTTSSFDLPSGRILTLRKIGSAGTNTTIFSGGSVSITGELRMDAPNAGGGTFGAQVIRFVNATGETQTITGPITGVANANNPSYRLWRAADVTGSAGETILSGNNTYNGGTLILAGTLVARHASALGTGPVTLNAALAGTASAPCALLTDAPVTLANPVTLNTANNGNQDLTLGGRHTTGVSTFSGALVGAARTLKLQSLATGDPALHAVRLTGPISGAFTALTKTGAGNLILTGDNTHSGPLTISAGTLWVENSSGSATGSGAVTVQTGASLGGAGAISGAVTCQSGARLAFTLTTAPASHDRLDIGGALALNATPIDLSGTGATPGTYTLLQAASITGSPGTVTPPAGFTATAAVVGNQLQVTLASILTPLQSWRQTHFGQTAATGPAADTADPDADGAPNLLEYALGTAPTVATSISLPLASVDGSNRLTLTFTPVVVSGLTYIIQSSYDLAAWTDTVISPAALTSGQSFTFTDSVSVSENSRRFLRLLVTSP